MAIAPVITINNFMYCTKHMSKWIIKDGGGGGEFERSNNTDNIGLFFKNSVCGR